MTDEVSVCVALLHDVVEDTGLTFADLEREFPPEVTDALRLLTHEKGTDYFDYVRALRGNPVAVEVKLADLAHNSDESRLPGAGTARRSSLRNGGRSTPKPGRFWRTATVELLCEQSPRQGAKALSYCQPRRGGGVKVLLRYFLTRK